MSGSQLTLAAAGGTAYPERQLQRLPWYEAPARALVGHVKRPLAHSSARYGAIVGLTAAHEGGMAALKDAELPRYAATLGCKLRLHGFVPEIVSETFALVREAAGRTLGYRHFDVQLMGAWVLLSGRIAEMDTGEGKTLTATLAATVGALSGIPVHVITANDYLAERDAEEMGPLYGALGLKVGNPRHGMEPAERRSAYGCHVAYCSNKEIAFDFLRDRISIGERTRRLSVRLERIADSRSALHHLLLRGLCFGIVDEADSVLVDEARTPLIISASGGDGDPDGLFARAVELARMLTPGNDCRILAQERRVELTDDGKARLAQLTTEMDGVWRGPKRREQLVVQALSALHLFHRDEQYLIRDQKVQIIDEYTGRILEDRSWEQGLHQMVEVKESVPVTALRETLARTSYQHFFRRYLHLCGMTGTAAEIAPELHGVYGLDVVRLPTNRPLRRQALPARVFATEGQKWQAVAERVAQLRGQGRPVLVGTRTVNASEQASEALARAGIPHAVLSASQDLEEARIVAEAGRLAMVTVATNMAGRGTDIKLGPGVVEAGGLHVLATELHDARRIDRQLFGRCARQGDPGSHEIYLSLEDELIQTNLPASMRAVLASILDLPGGERQVARSLRLAQRRAERRNYAIRRRLLRGDERLEDTLAFAGSMN